MQKKIVYFVQQYNPAFEGISKEVKLLYDKFGRFVVNPVSDWNLGKYFAFRYRIFPFGVLFFPIFEYLSSITHVYTSLDNFFYLRLLGKRPLVLTGAGSYSLSKLKKVVKYYKKVDKVVVECERDKLILLDLGVSEEKVEIVYPCATVKNLEGKFSKKVIFASSPLMKEHYKTKGVDLLLDVAGKSDWDFVLFWRTKDVPNVSFDNVEFVTKIDKVEDIYSAGDVTIYLNRGLEGSKPFPNSVVESICYGRPVIVSEECGAADFVRDNKVGVVVGLDSESVLEGLNKIEKRYKYYKNNCLKVGKKSFSKRVFLNSYKKIYKNLR